MINFDDKIRQFLQNSLNETRITGKTDPFWTSLHKTGTEIWLDTGDMKEGESNWIQEMKAHYAGCAEMFPNLTIEEENVS